MQAHRDLESITLERDLWHYKRLISERYAELVYYGQWFSPLREALAAFIHSTQRFVSGVVKVKLYKGNATVTGRKSLLSLYRQSLATFEEGEAYNQKDAEGFIRLFGLPLLMEARRKEQK
jgi:argininosuccinate synthase